MASFLASLCVESDTVDRNHRREFSPKQSTVGFRLSVIERRKSCPVNQSAIAGINFRLTIVITRAARDT